MPVSQATWLCRYNTPLATVPMHGLGLIFFSEEQRMWFFNARKKRAIDQFKLACHELPTDPAVLTSGKLVVRLAGTNPCYLAWNDPGKILMITGRDQRQHSQDCIIRLGWPRTVKVTLGPWKAPIRVLSTFEAVLFLEHLTQALLVTAVDYIAAQAP